MLSLSGDELSGAKLVWPGSVSLLDESRFFSQLSVPFHYSSPTSPRYTTCSTLWLFSSFATQAACSKTHNLCLWPVVEPYNFAVLLNAKLLTWSSCVQRLQTPNSVTVVLTLTVARILTLSSTGVAWSNLWIPVTSRANEFWRVLQFGSIRLWTITLNYSGQVLL